ncbi:MAG: helix-turn-helix domain-containing protein [Acidobacteriaceae bacterium]|jgi:predicted transcriptional regulator
MKQPAGTAEASLELKALIFQMHMAGCTQDGIAAYVGKSKSTINEMLKPLQKPGKRG